MVLRRRPSPFGWRFLLFKDHHVFIVTSGVKKGLPQKRIAPSIFAYAERNTCTNNYVKMDELMPRYHHGPPADADDVLTWVCMRFSAFASSVCLNHSLTMTLWNEKSSSPQAEKFIFALASESAFIEAQSSILSEKVRITIESPIRDALSRLMAGTHPVRGNAAATCR